MTAPAYDVVVVGGRVAGASTALLLARAGARVAVVERGTRGADTLSTHGLMRAGVLQLSRWGLLDRVVAAGTPPISRTVFHYADETVTVSIKPSPGVDALYAPRRTVLDTILVDTAEESGVDLFHDTVVTSLLRAADGRVTGVTARDGRGRQVRLDAAITVGADGLRSAVASQVGARVLHGGTAASALLYGYVPDLDAAGYEWAYGDGSAAGLLPTNAGETCVFVATTPERLRHLRRAGTSKAFATLLAAAAPGFLERVDDASGVDRLRGWGGVSGHVRQSWGPGWALVGDAGYYRDPITTHGMSDALRDAELVADGILAVLGGTPEERALAAYQDLRSRLSTRLFAVTEELARFDWDDARVRGLLRIVSSAMSDEIDHLQARPERSDDVLAAAGRDRRAATDKVGRAG